MQFLDTKNTQEQGTETWFSGKAMTEVGSEFDGFKWQVHNNLCSQFRMSPQTILSSFLAHNLLNMASHIALRLIRAITVVVLSVRYCARWLQLCLCNTFCLERGWWLMDLAHHFAFWKTALLWSISGVPFTLTPETRLASWWFQVSSFGSLLFLRNLKGGGVGRTRWIKFQVIG